jgi:hypothetical protein
MELVSKLFYANWMRNLRKQFEMTKHLQVPNLLLHSAFPTESKQTEVKTLSHPYHSITIC